LRFLLASFPQAMRLIGDDNAEHGQDEFAGQINCATLAGTPFAKPGICRKKGFV
jgi:hypothetical protein